MSDKEKSIEAKNKGNAEFKQKNFEKAIEHYTNAIELDSTNQVFYSNRSGCYTSLGQYAKS